MQLGMYVGPFGADTEWQRYLHKQYAATWVIRFMRETGAFIITPHLNTGIFYGEISEDFFRRGYLCTLKMVGFVLCPTPIVTILESEGGRAELVLASTIGKPIYFNSHQYNEGDNQLEVVRAHLKADEVERFNKLQPLKFNNNIESKEWEGDPQPLSAELVREESEKQYPDTRIEVSDEQSAEPSG